MKRLVMAMVGLCAAHAVAMPTQAELKKAQSLVAELMAPAMAKFKSAGAKEKTSAAVKVADTSVEFANAAETEAAKFLLLKGAVSFYTRGEAYDKAADAVTALQANVKNVTPEVIVEITGKATGSISETKAPRLFALYRSAKLQVRAASEAKSLAQKLKKVKSDALQRRYAEALAVSGDWKAAYAEFAKLSNDKLKAIVEAEASGKAKNAESGEFWWDYEPVMEDVDDIFKAHAAAFYRKALAAGEITGLKKNIVEQRIKEYGGVAGGGVKSAPAAMTPSAGQIGLKTGGDSPFTVKGNEATLTLKSGVKLEFVKCPSGWVKVVDDYERNSTRKVKITRPFWIMKRCLWKDDVQKEVQLRDSYCENGVQIFPAFSRIEVFCSDLTDDLKSVIPAGYVVRLPSIAEWEYAYHAGSEDPDDEPFGSLLCRHDVNLFNKHGGKTPVNKWGLCDFHVLEKVLDRVNPKSVNVFEKEADRVARLPDSKQNDDLLYWENDLTATANLVRLASWHKLRIARDKTFGSVRLVIGPDLVSEWKAKNGKK